MPPSYNKARQAEPVQLCPLLDKVFNDTATSFDDIYYPPNCTKPPRPEIHKEYKVAAIRQLINVLNWWVIENVADPKLLCFYAYSYGPCKLRAIVTGGGNTINDLITEFNYIHPKIAAEIENRWNNLVNKATEWDKLARAKQTSQNWIDPYYLNPVEVKDAANALLNKLRHIVSIVKEEQKARGGNEAGDTKKTQEKDGQSNSGKVDSPNEKSSETWYWKLYEKTIKAVIAAILDKVNPS